MKQFMIGSIHGQHRKCLLPVKIEQCEVDCYMNSKGTFKWLLGQLEIQRLLSRISTREGKA